MLRKKHGHGMSPHRFTDPPEGSPSQGTPELLFKVTLPNVTVPTQKQTGQTAAALCGEKSPLRVCWGFFLPELAKNDIHKINNSLVWRKQEGLSLKTQLWGAHANFHGLLQNAIELGDSLAKDLCSQVSAFVSRITSVLPGDISAPLISSPCLHSIFMATYRYIHPGITFSEQQSISLIENILMYLASHSCTKFPSKSPTLLEEGVIALCLFFSFPKLSGIYNNTSKASKGIKPICQFLASRREAPAHLIHVGVLGLFRQGACFKIRLGQ